MSGQDNRPSRFGNLLALRQEKEQRGAGAGEIGAASAASTDDADESATAEAAPNANVAGIAPPSRPAPPSSAGRTARGQEVNSARPAESGPNHARPNAGRGETRAQVREDRMQPQPGPHVVGAKRPQSIAVYDANWRWLRDQASGTDFEEGYARASQVAAEILAAAQETGLDVRSARNLDEVRLLALQHFGRARE